MLRLHRLQTLFRGTITARVLDITLGTIRIVFVSRGKKFLAFYSVEDVRQVSRGVFPARKPV